MYFLKHKEKHKEKHIEYYKDEKVQLKWVFQNLNKILIENYLWNKSNNYKNNSLEMHCLLECRKFYTEIYIYN